MSRHGSRLLAAALALWAAGCGVKASNTAPQVASGGGSGASGGSGSTGDVPHHSVGSTSFTSQPPGGGGARGAEAGAQGASSSGGAASNASPGASHSGGASSSSSRSIVEADVYKVDGNNLYVLNGYRGLQILDTTDLAHPALVGHVPVLGRPIDLYVRGTTAYVVVSDVFQYGGGRPLANTAAAVTTTTPWLGSQVWAIDVSQPASPQVLSVLPVEGSVEQTRIVGDVLYVISDFYSWYDWGNTSSQSLTYVESFDLSNPAALTSVQRIDFPEDGWSVHANVTEGRIVLSQSGWQDQGNGQYGPVTTFVPIDISDPAGALVQGSSFSTVGSVDDRWAMDYDPKGGIFRAVTNGGRNNGGVLHVFRAPDVQHAIEVGSLALDLNETVTASSFDTNRAYIVTAYCTDPLFVIDTTDPERPTLLGSVSMPGALDFVLPRGNQLLAMGHDSPGCSAWSGNGQLALSLFDVTDGAHPVLQSRVDFGQAYSQINATKDDFKKAIQVLDALGLVLVPYQSWDSTSWTYRGGTQLIDLLPDGLALRGFAQHAGAIKRAFPVRDRLIALSDRTLQVLDATDRDHPQTVTELDLARPVIAVAPVGSDLVELSGDWYSGDTRLVVTAAATPDQPQPKASLSVAAPYARMFRDGDVLWLLATDWSTNQAWLQAVDVSVPNAPVLRGRLDLDPAQVGYSYGWYWSWGWGSEAGLVGHALVLHAPYWGCYSCGSSQSVDQVLVVDLTNPDAPALGQPVVLPGSDWSWGLLAQGDYVWITHYQWVPNSNWGLVRYYVDRIDLTRPASPRLLASINVPGVLVAASDDGQTLYTQEVSWPSSGGSASTTLHKLDLLPGGLAALDASTTLAGYPEGADTAGGYAYLQTYSWDPTTYATSSTLSTVRLDDLLVTDSQALGASWSWLRKAEGGKLFVQAAWYDSSLLVYDLADQAVPQFQGSVRSSGWINDVVVDGHTAYLPSGEYGVPVVDLTPGSVPTLQP